MKRRALIRHLSAHGCVLIRESGNHSWWGISPTTAAPRFPATPKWTIFS